MRSYTFPAVRRGLGYFALRNPQQQINQIDAGKVGAHRFDQTRVAVDKEVRALLRHDEVDRQCAVPAEPLPNCCDIGAHLWPPHALLDRFTATGAGGYLLVSMKAEQLAARKYGLRFFGRARDQVLHQPPPPRGPLS